jgi:hypothetical protein
MQTTARRSQLQGKVNGPWVEKSANECDHFHHFLIVLWTEIGHTTRAVFDAGLLSPQHYATKKINFRAIKELTFFLLFKKSAREGQGNGPHGYRVIKRMTSLTTGPTECPRGHNFVCTWSWSITSLVLRQHQLVLAQE